MITPGALSYKIVKTEFKNKHPLCYEDGVKCPKMKKKVLSGFEPELQGSFA